ncbi:MAG: TonB-dependent receptor [Alistipes sp.]|nr:TonB-dependent receptor [Alistipes sp.]
MKHCNRIITLLMLLMLTLPTSAHTSMHNEAEPADTTIVVDHVQVTAIKQGLVLRSEPVAATIVGERAVDRNHITALKDMAEMVPNLHIPDYGSRMTSSIYVRGLGARIDQPAIGLTVDNVPMMQKNGFDTELSDIERIEVLRGPQSTLYGRNTMGGVINIYTLSPFNYQGSRIESGYSSGNTFRLRASTYVKFSDKWATSLSAYTTSSDGFFRNEFTGEKADWEKSDGGRWKLLFRNNKGLRIENTLSFAMTEQGGYPYAFIGGRSEGTANADGYVVTPGQIAYNDTCRYERFTLSDGLTIHYETERHSLSSITSYQLTDDDMRLDNDFTPLDYFTLRQAIKEHVVTEDLIFRSRGARTYNYLFGLYGFYRAQKMEAPVLFKTTGVDEIIFKAANASGRVEMHATEDMPLNSSFKSPAYGFAAYHESSLKFGKWEAKAGLRIEHEQVRLETHGEGSLKFNLKAGQMPFPIPQEPITLDTESNYKRHFTELLPKLAFIYRFDENRNLYATFSRGFKAGGFNTQIYSDVLKEMLQTQAMGGKFEESDILSYDPEYSWNYEVGGHFSCADGVVRGDFSLFMIDCRDQQLTVLADANATGRMMTNAGRTRSLGGELALQLKPWRTFDIDLAYGYTNATFRHYVDGEQDFRGNYVPFAPQHTLSAGLTWTIPTGVRWLGDVVLHGGMRGVGKIYWDEANTVSQPYYTTFNASVRLEHRNYAIDFWGQNLSDKTFDVFYFESIGNRFVQRGRGRILGVTLRINLQ